MNSLKPLGKNGEALVSPYIVNGDIPTYGKWPFYLRLNLRVNALNHIGCGGTLVSDRHVLTAAHCTYWINGDEALPYDIMSIMGEHDSTKTNKWEQASRAKRVCRSKRYNSSGTVNDDWALLELEEPVKITHYVRPACLPFEPVIRTGKTAQCYTLGFGMFRDATNNDELIYPWYMREMRIEQVTCKAYSLNDRDRSRECYAKAKRHQGTSCYGDSGGPALCMDKRGRWTLVGVTSYADDEPGLKCSGNGPKAWKTVFARVRTLLKDIKQQCNF